MAVANTRLMEACGLGEGSAGYFMRRVAMDKRAPGSAVAPVVLAFAQVCAHEGGLAGVRAKGKLSAACGGGLRMAKTGDADGFRPQVRRTQAAIRVRRKPLQQSGQQPRPIQLSWRGVLARCVP